MSCLACQKPTPEGHNYCGWECHVEDAKRNGGTAHCPNGLPVRCIRADGTMLEHEHGDHPDYKFPVEVEYVGDLSGTGDPGDDIAVYGRVLNDQEAREAMGQTHALIYTDGCIAVTLYEHVYAMWSGDGLVKAGQMWKKGEWQLAQASRDKIAALHAVKLQPPTVVG